LIDGISQQMLLANEALKSHNLDLNYLQREHGDTLLCPTCGAEHIESFLDFFSYTEDARVLRELVVKMQRDRDNAESDYRQTKLQLSELSFNYKKVSQILDTRRGDLVFKDVVES